MQIPPRDQQFSTLDGQIGSGPSPLEMGKSPLKIAQPEPVKVVVRCRPLNSKEIEEEYE